MSLLRRALIVGLLIGILGVNMALVGPGLEEKYGLSFLYWLRGPRQPPADVVIVALDKKSSAELNLHEDPAKWPRSLHARLIEILTEQEAAVIAFDILFDEVRTPEDDRRLATAIHAARNVVLCE
ncbi:MAG: CHASE2 domain-containing protein, partial [Desulfobacterales bacterium]